MIGNSGEISAKIVSKIFRLNGWICITFKINRDVGKGFSVLVFRNWIAIEWKLIADQLAGKEEYKWKNKNSGRGI